jgi:hypothetical protein
VFYPIPDLNPPVREAATRTTFPRSSAPHRHVRPPGPVPRPSQPATHVPGLRHASGGPLHVEPHMIPSASIALGVYSERARHKRARRY